MAHFAEIDSNNKVIRVLVFNETFTTADCKTLLGGEWLKASYNSKIKKNFPAIGYNYDSNHNAFIPPKPQNAIGFNEETCLWILPEQKLP